ncbi:MAG: methyltransferase domain-containing protein [Armatimonadetes bacterium]|nr:methyltransferase domain-containing protein [Armatimonadota bacterium]
MTFFNAEAYERLMGRWSRRLAPLLIEFAEVREGNRVLDVGSGTGSLTLALNATRRSEVVGIDPSPAYVEHARTRTADPRVRFDVGDAQALPYPDASFDKCLALLVINFIPDARKAVAEMRRVTRPGGRVAAAVWDYGDGMTMLNTFWDAAVAIDPAAEPRHERHMPYCRRGQLSGLWTEIGIQEVEETGLVIPMDFASFDDFWSPFLGGQGPSGSYVTSLPPDRQRALRERLRKELLAGKPDEPFTLEARAWAVRGTTPDDGA